MVENEIERDMGCNGLLEGKSEMERKKCGGGVVGEGWHSR